MACESGPATFERVLRVLADEQPATAEGARPALH